MENYLEDIPSEVWWVVSLQHRNQPVGLEVYNRIQEIIDKYPEYFEWEHKYKAIPDEVHEAFNNECYPPEKPVKSNGKGIMAYIEESEVVTFSVNKKDIIQLLKGWQESVELEREKKDAETRRIKKIWNKHYGKFKLKYRK